MIVIINASNEQHDLKFSLANLDAIVKEVIQKEQQTCDEVNIYFVDTATICKLHLDYFNDDTPTDCISFPMDKDENSPYKILGEIFVCPQTAIEYALSHELDPYEETTLYLVHGLLHLMGYDDLEENDFLIMKEAEIRHMTHLKKLELYIK
ncbi:unnamed protein product [Candidatus Protochlamydia amoebophila UWE25]|uniref:Endoribonuclease YbeY n=1 Tax=Protochlamydia amoebophila (strain UWE25) TaxID=264201 RepID=YBEY_PARUW|nr:RecName: Full=Endoribonuclease YbeY [Candidatus Protochlamydia amoebophila UWE25]CAF23778.1 unnamed protein product [Candidatus Protochlamydia amoebophila UWE25]